MLIRWNAESNRRSDGRRRTVTARPLVSRPRGESLDQRLAEEEPEMGPKQPVYGQWRPLDDNIDDVPDQSDPDPPRPDTASARLSEPARHGQSADVAGGSVAESLRQQGN